MSYSTKRQFEPGSWEEVLYDIYSGVTVGTTHSLWFVKNQVLRSIGLAGEEKNAREGSAEKTSLKVIGVGYGRTGTYSLALALEELGFPTLHTQHLYEDHEVFDMWVKGVFLPSIMANETTMGSPDFDLIASSGYQATMDLPMALYFKEVKELFPDCKFILTTRENSEIWFRSWDTLTRSISQPAQYGNFFSHVRKIGYYLRWLFSVVNKDTKFLTHPFPLPNQIKRKAIASYEEHNRRVRETIPASHLLEYNVKQGWEPLCEFLEVSACPTTPFPKSNSARAVQVQAISSMIVPLTVVMFILFSFFSCTFQKLTGKPVLQWVNIKRMGFLAALSNWGQKRAYREKKRV